MTIIIPLWIIGILKILGLIVLGIVIGAVGMWFFINIGIRNSIGRHFGW
jgi:hypothetical protein